MREFSVPAIEMVADDENLTDMVFANAERFPDTVAFRRRVDGAWSDITTAEFASQVQAVAKGLMAAGLRTGDRVGLMSKTRYEWTLLDFALWTAGCVPVPIYETSSAEQVEWILSNSGAVAVIVEAAQHDALVRGVLGRLTGVEYVWQIERTAGGDGAIEQLTAAGASIPDADVHRRRRSVRAADVATLVYTSGTTGKPKGCELTHYNLLAEVQATHHLFPAVLQAGNSLLLFLPLAHVLARALVICCMYSRVAIGHTSDVQNLVTDLGSFRPTFVVAVPRVFEKVYNSAKQKAHAEGKGKIFDVAEATAVEYSISLDTGGPGIALRLRRLLFDKLVYGKLRAALGGRCDSALSGSAPLGERLAHFFRGIGVPVYEGYGLTETSAAITLNTEQHVKIGTVGRPVAGAAVKVADDGEILLSGEMVFQGYWDNGQATTEAFSDGWFNSGDIGELDDDGFLRITGRKKELIVTAGGKNVSPAVLEDKLRAHPLISQCVVVGDQQPFISALITVDEDFFPAWKQQHGKPEHATVAEMTEDADLRAEIQAAIDLANATVSRAESIRKFQVLPKDFTEQDGELTPSLKLRRNVVAKTYAQEIDALYTS